MSILSKQIGWSNESNLLWDILNQIDRLTGVISQSGGGGGGSGTVTSVGMTVPTFLSVLGSPITTTGTLAVTLSGTPLPIANGGTGSTTNTAWLLASGGTLTGANIITGTATNILKFNFDGLSVTSVEGAGHWLANNTAAAAGVQQISPSITLEGQGWKTNATAASQSVKFMIDVLPVQGAANPGATLRFRSSINEAAYLSPLTVSSEVNTGIAISSNFLNFSATAPTINFSGSGQGSIRFSGSSGQINYNLTSVAPVAAGAISLRNVNANATMTSGTHSEIGIGSGFAPASGTTVYNMVVATQTINNAGNGVASLFNIAPTWTAHGGDAYFLNYNPTVTSITGVHYAARFVSGNVLIGGTALTTSAILDLQSTTRAFIPPRMTTVQRDAIASPSAGMMIYNTSTNKLNVYTTAWEAITSI